MNQQQKEIVERYFYRMYSDTSSVEYIVRNVCVYRFLTSWTETGIEGRLYLCRVGNNHGLPLYRAVILHKKKPERLSIEISPGRTVDYHDRFVIFKQSGTEGHIGLWFSSARESQAFYKCVVGSATDLL